MLTAPPAQPPAAPPKHTGPPDDGDDTDKLIRELVGATSEAMMRAVSGQHTLVTRGEDLEAFIGVLPMAGIPRDIAEQALERWHQWVLDYRPGDEFEPEAV
jgi:hypothetical protein